MKSNLLTEDFSIETINYKSSWGDGSQSMPKINKSTNKEAISGNALLHNQGKQRTSKQHTLKEFVIPKLALQRTFEGIPHRR